MNRGQDKKFVDSVDGVVARDLAPRTRSQIKSDDYLGIGTPPPDSKAAPRVVSLEIKLPKLPKINLPKVNYRRVAKKVTKPKAAAAILLILVLGLGVAQLTKNHDKTGAGTNPQDIKPDFNAVVPLDKPDIANKQGDSVTYDVEKHVLSYTDTYFNETFTVSQQKLPDNLKSNPEELKKLAATMGSSHEVSTHRGMVYVATNQKTKEQTGVFPTGDLLLFIRTPREVDDTTWNEYVNKLNTQ